MANAINWESSPSLTSYLTTELNSLANGSNKIGAEIDNSTGLDMYVDVELNLAAQGSARSAGAYVPVFLIPTIDGTNYTYGDDSTDPPAHQQIGALLLDAATTARRVGLQMMKVPPGKFKLLIMNETGQAFASSGTTFGYRLYSPEIQ